MVHSLEATAYNPQPTARGPFAHSPKLTAHIPGLTDQRAQPTDHSFKHDQTWVGGVLPKLGQYKNTLIGNFHYQAERFLLTSKKYFS